MFEVGQIIKYYHFLHEYFSVLIANVLITTQSRTSENSP
jgi:hypothetical protein